MENTNSKLSYWWSLIIGSYIVVILFGQLVLRFGFDSLLSFPGNLFVTNILLPYIAGVATALWMIFLYRKSTTKGMRMSVIIAFIIAAPFSFIIVLLGGLTLSAFLFPVIALIPHIIIVGITYLVAKHISKKNNQ